jgi:hypothetical protein
VVMRTSTGFWLFQSYQNINFKLIQF